MFLWGIWLASVCGAQAVGAFASAARSAKVETRRLLLELQAAPQLHAVAFGPSGVAAGLPEQDEVARSQLHDHGFGWFAHRLVLGRASQRALGRQHGALLV